MVTILLERVVSAVLWAVFFPLMLILVGVPACVYLVGRQSRGGLWAFAAWIGAAQAGWVPTFAGPFGLPTIVFWPAALLFAGWMALGMISMGSSAWSSARSTWAN